MSRTGSGGILSVAMLLVLAVGCGGPDLESRTFECASAADCAEGFVCQRNEQMQQRCIEQAAAEREVADRRGETTDIACDADADCARGYVCQADDQANKRCIGTRAAAREVEQRRDEETAVACESEADCGKGYVCQADERMNKRCIGTKAAERERADRVTTVTETDCTSEADCAAGYVCRPFGARQGRDCVGTEVVVDISAGYRHTCAVMGAGRVRCWGVGDDPERAEGDKPKGFFGDFNQAVAPEADGFVDVSAGAAHTCAVKKDGGLECWGLGDEGVGTEEWGETRYKPDGNYGHGQAAEPSGANVRGVEAGANHSCGVTEGGRVRCWGAMTRDRGADQAFVQVSAGGGVDGGAIETHTCAVDETGRLRCWGRNDHGQTEAPLGTYAQVSAGAKHTCAVKTGGEVTCWGKTNEDNDEPNVSDSPGGTFRQVSASNLYNCGVLDGGLIDCWGASRNFPVMLSPDDPRYVQVTTGIDYACALTEKGTVDCWGEQSNPGTGVPSELKAE